MEDKTNYIAEENRTRYYLDEPLISIIIIAVCIFVTIILPCFIPII